MDLKALIDNNMAILDAELDNKEILAEQKLARQRQALGELRDEIEPIIKEAGYHIALFKTAKHHLSKPRCHEEQFQFSDEIAWLLKIEFEYSECLKDTGESENYYVPSVRKHDRQHCGGNDPSYIKISWDDTKGVRFRMVPNVAYDWNEEREDVDKRIYLELDGSKDMIIERLAIVLANIIRLEINFEKVKV
jgi:hypothetical protein